MPAVSDCAFVIALIVLACLIYGNTLQDSFLFDDFRVIRENPRMRMTSLSLEGLAAAAQTSRPVARISFALNYLFHGYDVFGYHLVNILSHIATGIALYFLAKTTLGLVRQPGSTQPDAAAPAVSAQAFLAAALWIVHPVNTQAVTYIVQRMTSMSALFYVLALLMYARGRMVDDRTHAWFFFGCCACAGILAFGSKETAIMLPVFIVVYEWYFFQDLSWAWMRKCSFVFGVIALLFCAAVFFYLKGSPVEAVLSGYENYNFTPGERMLTQLRVVVFYMSLLAWPQPSRLNLDHAFAVSHTLFDPFSTFVCLVALVGLVVLAICISRKHRILSFSIVWFLGNLLIESSFIGIELVYEHRLYLPAMFLFVAAVRPFFMNGLHKTAIVALCALVVVWGYWAHVRNRVWADPVVMWTDCVQKSPNSARPLNNLGDALMNAGSYDQAMACFRQALAIDPAYETAYCNIGEALLKRGKLDEAAEIYTKALEVHPDFAKVRTNFGNVLFYQGRVDKAIEQYRLALRINPDSAKTHCNLGTLLLKRGMLNAAIKHYRRALELDPFYNKAQSGLQKARMRQRLLHGS